MVTAMLVLVVVALSAAVVLLAYARRREGSTSPSAEIVPLAPPSPPEEPVAPVLTLVPAGRTETDPALIARLGDSMDLFSVEPVDRGVASLPSGQQTPVAALLGPLLGQAAETSEALRVANTLRVTFSPDVLAGLASGQYRFMETARGALTVVVDGKGQIVEHGTVITGISSMGVAGLALGGLAAVGAVAFQMQVLKALKGIETKADALVSRVRDDDWGALQAASLLVQDVQEALRQGAIPDQFRMELATAAMSIDALYFARKRSLSRLPSSPSLIDALADEPDEDHALRLVGIDETSDVRHGDAAISRKQLVRLIEQIGGDIPGFNEEAQLVLAADLTRAQVATARAVVLAMDGHPAAAQNVLLAARSRLRDDFAHLGGQMEVLLGVESARWRTKFRISDGKVLDLKNAASSINAELADLQADLLDDQLALPETSEAVLERAANGEWLEVA